MKAFYVLSMILGSVAAYADLIKPATLDVTCTSSSVSDRRLIRIVSNDQGSTVTLNGKIIMQQGQLTAGTEGGPAYLQAVGGGYNITISGGDFDKAFNASSTIRQGKAPATIWDSTNRTVRGVCKGLYSF
jgi:hypothetical protein